MRAGRYLGLLWLVGLGACIEQAREQPPPPAARSDAAPACEDTAEMVDIADQDPPEAACRSGRAEVLCFGQWAARCEADGDRASLDNCLAEDAVCAPAVCEGGLAGCLGGCLPCAPGAASCGAAGEVRVCDDDGQADRVLRECDTAAGLHCNASSRDCEDLCALAAERDSYIGCEYWAVPTANSSLLRDPFDTTEVCSPFPYAIAIANGNPFPAEVVVEQGGVTVESLTVAGGEVRSIELPCVRELFGIGNDSPSAIVSGAAYHLRSNVPITAYQFNPLEFEEEIDGESIYSHTNDASLLLPVHSLTPNYLVIARATMLNEIDLADGSEPERLARSGFVAIVGTRATPTRVTLTTSAYTRASADGRLSAHAPGDTFEVTLSEGEVLQLLSAAPSRCDELDSEALGGGPRVRYCRVPDTYDLSGTEIRADAPVSVIAGHDCSFVPATRWACDHLEETMLPQETWGDTLVVARPHPAVCSPLPPMLARVMSGGDGNTLHFEPAVHDDVTLDAGEWLELETREDFVVTGTGPLQVAQYLIGQDWQRLGSAGSDADGDPAMSLVIPRAQWRQSYDFLVPETFPRNFITVTAREDPQVILDGALLQGVSEVGDGETSIIRARVGPGTHHIESGSPFGLLVYGYATYTSYMVPGGLDTAVLQDVD